MSYILDALKKSEMERSRSAAPSLIGALEHAPSFRTKLLVVVAVALLANATAFTAWWFWPHYEQPEIAASFPSNATAEALPKPLPQMPTAALVDPSTPIAAAPPVVPALAAKPEPIEPKPVVVRQRTTFHALSAEEQRAFTPLEFSTHLFADDPSLRAVTMNGRRFKEGDALTDDLSLEEITEDGVVVAFRGKLVELPVLQDWRL